MLFFTFYKVHKHVDQKIALECSSSALEKNIMMNSDLPVKTSLVSVSTQTEALNWHCFAPCCKPSMFSSQQILSSSVTVDFECDVRIPFEIVSTDSNVVCSPPYPSDSNISNASSVGSDSDVAPHNLSNDQSYEPSSGGTDSEHISEGEDVPSHAVTPLEDVKLLVFQSNLLKLFTKCQTEPFCTAQSNASIITIKETLISVTSICDNHHTNIWYSQPFVNRMPVGNMLLAASTLYSGNTYTTLSEICSCLNFQIFSKSEFYNIQKKILLPSICHMWKSHQRQLFEGKLVILLVITFDDS